MNVTLWIFVGVLAAGFANSGLFKLVLSKEALGRSAFGKWSGEFGAGLLNFIGAVEVAGALGLVLPGLTGVAPVLVPLAAVGLALLMLGAAVVHLRRREYGPTAAAVVYLAALAFVAWGRFVVVPL